MPAKSFQSTLPARGATPAAVRGGAFHVISIHAPRTGSDSSWGSICAATGHFNPRSPHGERRTSMGLNIASNEFQSTLPARGATAAREHAQPAEAISIHAPRTGSDSSWGSICAATGHFNPRSPHGERRQHGGLMRATQRHFNPRSPHGERRAPSYAARDGFLFQSTLPARGATKCL